MRKKVCTLLCMVVGVMLLAGCSTSQVGTTRKVVESVYGIAHQDAKDLLNPSRDYLIVVNAENEYDFSGDYNKELQADLVFFPNVMDGDIMAAEKAAYLAFTSLQYDLKNNYGIEIALYDGYRTALDQEYINSLYNNGSPNIGNQNEVGFSEHHTGLLLDVVFWYSEDGKVFEWYSPSHERLESIPDFRVAYQVMVDYGFIMRYPDEKANITGMEGKEYEIRFVGSADVAHEIMDNGLCLEEYVSSKKN